MIWIYLSNLGMGGGSAAAAQSFRQALYAQLASIAAVTELVGAAIYPDAIPETHDFARDGPALCWTIVSNPRGQVLGGSDGTSQARVSLRAWSYFVADVDALTTALFTALNGPPGPWGNGTCDVTSVTQQDESDENVPPKTGDDRWQYTIISEYLIRYRL